MATMQRHGYPHKGIADTTWPGCKNCDGFGVLTGEVLIGKQGRQPGFVSGAKGDTCQVCNGVGRVPSDDWDECPAACDGEEACPVCAGLGRLSPHRKQAVEAGTLRVPCVECQGAGSVPYRRPRYTAPTAAKEPAQNP
jgi:DnaJ-class molecular chaperone